MKRDIRFTREHKCRKGGVEDEPGSYFITMALDGDASNAILMDAFKGLTAIMYTDDSCTNEVYRSLNYVHKCMPRYDDKGRLDAYVIYADAKFTDVALDATVRVYDKSDNMCRLQFKVESDIIEGLIEDTCMPDEDGLYMKAFLSL